MKQLKNYMEEMVIRFLNERLADTGACQCEDCRLDIAAIMLNKLQPHYVVTEKGALFAQLKRFDLQYEIDATVAMMEAVETVKKRPMHEQ